MRHAAPERKKEKKGSTWIIKEYLIIKKEEYSLITHVFKLLGDFFYPSFILISNIWIIEQHAKYLVLEDS